MRHQHRRTLPELERPTDGIKISGDVEMAKYRHALPQRHGGIFLTDGGMETTLIFQEGIELPHFAAFVLLDSAEGRQHLKRYYAAYLSVARDHGTGFVLDSPTWRANPDWGAKLGYDAAALRAINVRSIAFLEDLRAGWERPGAPCVISGAIGPRGDGYKAGNMDADEAEAYHQAQIAAFVEGGADMVTAYTLTGINEAIGIARAARSLRIPAAISFTVETNGRLVKGETLREAIETVDRETDGSVGILPDQLRPSDAFRRCLEGGRDLDGAYPWRQGQRLDQEPRRTRRIRNARCRRPDRSRAALRESQGRVPEDAYSRRLLRHRSPARQGDLRGLRAAAGA